MTLGCALVLAVPGSSASTAGSTYRLMQMNLCLSGLGGCSGNVAYPAVVTGGGRPDPRSASGRGHVQRGLLG